MRIRAGPVAVRAVRAGRVDVARGPACIAAPVPAAARVAPAASTARRLRRPGPPSLVGWRRGLIHPHYRSCWYDNVWYDAAGYAYYAPGYTATTVVQQPVVVPQPVVVQQPVVQPTVAPQPVVVPPPTVVAPTVPQTVVAPTVY